MNSFILIFNDKTNSLETYEGLKRPKGPYYTKYKFKDKTTNVSVPADQSASVSSIFNI